MKRFRITFIVDVDDDKRVMDHVNKVSETLRLPLAESIEEALIELFVPSVPPLDVGCEITESKAEEIYPVSTGICPKCRMEYNTYFGKMQAHRVLNPRTEELVPCKGGGRKPAAK